MEFTLDVPFIRDDRLLAWLAAFGTLSWLAVSIAFGAIIKNLVDVRVIVFVILTVGLIAFSVRDALAKPLRLQSSLPPP